MPDLFQTTSRPRWGVSRRSFLSLIGGAAAVGLAGCAGESAATGGLKTTDPLPTAVPEGASLSIASSQQLQELAVKYAGLTDSLPFQVSSWPNIGAGPDV